MPKRVRAAAISDIQEDEGFVFEAPGEEIAIFKIEGRFFACSARCPHAGGPLNQGFLDGTSVSCPWHGWSFELDCKGNPPRDGVERYAVVVEGDDLYLELPD
jgi:nitrite reductase/ring-hydroxylating ferredoxin subunit